MRPHTRGTNAATSTLCLEEHGPGLGRDDRDEAEHEVDFRAHFGDV